MSTPPVATAIVRAFQPDDTPDIIRLILSIQREEFGVAITAEDQPDLGDIPSYYLNGLGGFWVATGPNGAVVGTIGLKDIGNRDVALRKMFVHPDYRGASGIASTLLQHAIDRARDSGVRRIYLGTTDKFLAAHRFYEKNGFRLIAQADLPATFPRMAVDTRFYVTDL